MLNSMKLSSELFDKYKEDPIKMDDVVRNVLVIPDDKYYAVTMEPEHLKGNIRLTDHRICKTPKISKSSQQS